MDVEHTKALTDAEIDADLVGDSGLYYDPDASYPEYGNGTVRWAYRLGVDAGAAAVPALVAAVERVQAIAEHWSTCPKGDYDCHDCNYNRPEAGDLLLEALKLETP